MSLFIETYTYTKIHIHIHTYTHTQMTALSLIEFLDEIETQAEDEEIEGETSFEPMESRGEDDAEGNDNETSSNFVNMFGDIKEKMISLQLQIGDKDRVIETLKEAMARMKSRNLDERSKAISKNKESLATQKQEYENALERQMDLMNTLLKEKDELNQKVERLCLQLEQHKSESVKKMNLLKAQENVKVKKLRERWKAAEKLQRERWAEETRFAIKNDTIRALEPEVQRLIDQNAKDKRRLQQEKEVKPNYVM